MKWTTILVASVAVTNPSCLAFQNVNVQSPFTSTRSSFMTAPKSKPSLPSSLRVPQTRTTTSTSFKTTTELQALSLAAAASPIGAVGVLAFIVLIHEAGHYTAARHIFGMAVEEFSIGFGPRIAGFTAWGNEFNLRALPLGGYVRFPENYNITQAQEMQELQYETRLENRERAQELRKEQGGPWNVLNFVSFGALEKKMFREQKEADQQAQIQLWEEQVSKQTWWSKTFGGNKKMTPPLLEDEADLAADYEIEYYDDPNLLQNRPWYERAVVLSAGVFMNFVLSLTLYFGVIGFGNGIPQPVFSPGVIVNQMPRQDGAAYGRLQQGDIILSVNGYPIKLEGGVSAASAQKEVGDVISAIRETPEGGSVQLSVLRAGDTNNKDAKTPLDINVQPQRASASGPQTIGVMLGPNFLEIKAMKSDNLLEASALAWRYTSEITSQTFNGLVTVFGTLLMGGASPAGQSVSGPIGLIKTGSQVVATQDWTTVFLFAAALSVNLGVINALPLPALDGGQLAFVLSEALTGKKVNQRLQEGITSVTVLFLLFVTLSTTIGDVTSIFFSK